jgi:hypothetical protein
MPPSLKVISGRYQSSPGSSNKIPPDAKKKKRLGAIEVAQAFGDSSVPFPLV